MRYGPGRGATRTRRIDSETAGDGSPAVAGAGEGRDVQQ